MAADHPSQSGQDERLYEALVEFLESSEAGKPLSATALMARYPEYARELKEYLETRARVDRLTAPVRQAAHTLIAAALSWSGSDPPVAVGVEPAATFPPDEPASAPGRYHLLGEIARGGMGTILRGHDNLLNREIAFKFLLGKYRADPEMRRRFAHEARVTGRLQHPGIVPVYETGQFPDARPFFTMPLVRGRSLAEVLDERPDPSRELPHFLKIFEQVCQTVAYAHSRGVIHRDLKPANVMVAPFGVVQVMDWGLAKELRRPDAADGPDVVGQVPEEPADAADADEPEKTAPGDHGGMTSAGRVVGTPSYMAPEQARGEGELLDERVDVFGLGAILCVILTGKPPYTSGPREEVRARAAAGDLAETLARLDACPAEREIVRLAKCCLSADPSARLRSAGEVAAAVTAYLESDLRRAERDLVRFFDLSPDLFCVAGFDGFFRRVNANFTRVLGYTDQELRRRPFLDFVHPDDRESTLAEMEKLSRGLPAIYFTNRYRDVAGNYRWFEWMGKPIPEEGVIFAVARDVTERIRLEERLRAATAGGATPQT